MLNPTDPRINRVPIQKILQKKQKAVRRRTPLIKQVLNPIAPLSGSRMDNQGEFIECHPGNYELQHTNNCTMTQPADPSIVMGNFDGQSVDTRVKVHTTFLRRAEFAGVEIPNQVLSGIAWPMLGAFVFLVMTTGSHHMQVYWLPLASGRTLGQLPRLHFQRSLSVGFQDTAVSYKNLR